jgi:hypothetical protein
LRKEIIKNKILIKEIKIILRMSLNVRSATSDECGTDGGAVIEAGQMRVIVCSVAGGASVAAVPVSSATRSVVAAPVAEAKKVASATVEVKKVPTPFKDCLKTCMVTPPPGPPVASSSQSGGDEGDEEDDAAKDQKFEACACQCASSVCNCKLPTL